MAPRGFALFAAVLFTAAATLGVLAGRLWADWHPGRPMVVAERDGLKLEVRLPTDRYLAGEVLAAEVLVQNVSEEPLLLNDVHLTLRDEQGQGVQSEGFWLARRPSGRDGDVFHYYNVLLPPGESFRETQLYRVPPEAAAGGRSLGAWVSAWASGRGDRSVEVGPIPLKIAAPRPAQRLRADVQVEQQGWRLRVTDGLGRPLTGPFWGETLEWISRDLRWEGSLGPSADGTWSVPWNQYLVRTVVWTGRPFTLLVWVAAPGYVSAYASTKVAGTVSRAE